MSHFKVDFKGMAAARAAFRRLPDVTQVRLGQAAQATAFQIAQRARTNAPRRTGTLADAIDSSYSPQSGFARAGVTRLVGDLGERPSHYAHLVEFGHGGKHPAPAHPFMIPAAEAERDPYLTRCREAGRDVEADLSSGGGLL